MNSPQPYNPLAIESIAHSIEATLLQQQPVPVESVSSFVGSGIYLIYYTGDFEPYLPISGSEFERPIYVGKAVSPGARKGVIDGSKPTRSLEKRLNEHRKSLEQAANLDVGDFSCRLLVVEDFFIPLGEQIAVRHFRPLWNQVVDGFGNHAPGSGRASGKRPDWDTLHPGRPWASKLGAGRSEEEILDRVAAHFEQGDTTNEPEGSTTTPIPPPPLDNH